MSTSAVKQKIFRKRNRLSASIACVHDGLERQLSAFLRKKRGDSTYAKFARKLGITPSTLHRLENSQQSATLRILQQIMSRLKSDLSDLFPENCSPKPASRLSRRTQ